MCEFLHLLLRCAAVILISVCVCKTQAILYKKKSWQPNASPHCQLLLVVTKQPNLSQSHTHAPMRHKKTHAPPKNLSEMKNTHSLAWKPKDTRRKTDLNSHWQTTECPLGTCNKPGVLEERLCAASLFLNPPPSPICPGLNCSTHTFMLMCSGPQYTACAHMGFNMPSEFVTKICRDRRLWHLQTSRTTHTHACTNTHFLWTISETCILPGKCCLHIPPMKSSPKKTKGKWREMTEKRRCVCVLGVSLSLSLPPSRSLPHMWVSGDLYVFSRNLRIRDVHRRTGERGVVLLTFRPFSSPHFCQGEE